MFAAMWDFRRKGWEYRSGGAIPTAPSASGLFRSTDGGNTWTEITEQANKGFPKKPYGRLAVAIAPSKSQRVYAFVESPESALFVSDDGGATWDKRDKSQWMVWRPFYFANLIVDPKNPDRLFKPDGVVDCQRGRRQELCGRGRFSGRAWRLRTMSGSIRPTHRWYSRETTAGCGTPTTAAANGGKAKTCRSRNFTT